MSVPTNERLHPVLLRMLTVISVIIALATAVSLVSLVSPWVDSYGYASFGPPGTLLVVVAGWVAIALIGNIGPRVRSTERPAYRVRLEAAKARGLRGKAAMAEARIPYPPHVRAGRAIGGGALAAAAGALEAFLVAYNSDRYLGQGLTLGIGVDLAQAAATALLFCAAVAIVVGVLGLVLDTVPGVTTVPPPVAGFGATVMAPTLRVAESLPAYASPVGGVPVAMLDPGLPVVELERAGAWTHIRAENGWEGWVDGTRLAPLGSPATPPMPPMPVG